MEKEKLAAILAAHSAWCRSGGLKGKRADLQRANLQGADLQEANLQGVNLQEANLQGADLQRADLQGADLQRADLQRADLRVADLRVADLRVADLRRADLQEAYLRRADLRGADLQGAELPHFQITPEEGAFIAFKSVKGGILKLEIPSDAKRVSSLIGRRCRASHVRVLGAYKMSDAREILPDIVFHSKYNNLEYRIGETTYADAFDDDIRVENTHGIHFFMTYREVLEH